MGVTLAEVVEEAVGVDAAGAQERRWLPRHVGGDDAAFPELVAAYRRPVYAYLVRTGLDGSERDDLFQEIFVKVHRAAGSYQPERPLKPWLFTIVANTVRSHFRKQRPVEVELPGEQTGGIADGATGSHELVELRDTVAWLEGAIATLTLAQREVLICSCVEGMEQREVSIALQIPVNTVKTHLRRARLRLTEMRLERDRTMGGTR